MELNDNSSNLCRFISPFGYYKFNRISGGLSCAPEVFITLNLKYFGNVDPDNIPSYIFWRYFIATIRIEKHNELLENIVSRKKKLNIKFNSEKNQFKEKQVNFLGNEKGVSPDNKHVQAIVKLNDPINKREL